jgi:hypothetical protein
MIVRMVKAYGKRVAGQTEVHTVPDIAAFAALVALRTELDGHIKDAAQALHKGTDDVDGHSWAEIGKVLGITRQSARERFMPADTPPAKEDPRIE